MVAKKEVKKKEVVKTLGIAELSKLLKREPATVRGMLRAANVKKAGRGYEWPNLAAIQKVAKQLTAA